MKKMLLFPCTFLFLFGLYSYKSSSLEVVKTEEKNNTDSLKLFLNSFVIELEERERIEIELLKTALLDVHAELMDYSLQVEMIRSTKLRIYYVDDKNRVTMTRNLGKKNEKDTAFINGEIRKLKKEGNGFKLYDEILKTDYTIYFGESAFLDSIKRLNGK